MRSQALAEVQGFLHERVQGMSVIKSFAIEDNEAKILITITNFYNEPSNIQDGTHILLLLLILLQI